jgi:hypothetical protein
MQKAKRTTIRTLSGAAIAAAAAGLFMSQAAIPAFAAEQAKVNCAGVNACKGKSECAGSKNGCAGQNECKGQGWMSMSEKDCKAKGGKVVKS